MPALIEAGSLTLSIIFTGDFSFPNTGSSLSLFMIRSLNVVVITVLISHSTWPD